MLETASCNRVSEVPVLPKVDAYAAATSGKRKRYDSDDSAFYHAPLPAPQCKKFKLDDEFEPLDQRESPFISPTSPAPSGKSGSKSDTQLLHKHRAARSQVAATFYHARSPSKPHHSPSQGYSLPAPYQLPSGISNNAMQVSGRCTFTPSQTTHFRRPLHLFQRNSVSVVTTAGHRSSGQGSLVSYIAVTENVSNTAIFSTPPRQIPPSTHRSAQIPFPLSYSKRSC